MSTRQIILLSITLSCLLPLTSLSAQKHIKRPDKFYTWVTEGASVSEPGYLTYLSRDTIVLNSSIMFENTVMANYEVRNVSQIRLRNRTNQAIGAISGLVGGGLIGFSMGSIYEGDDYCGNKCAGVERGTVTALSTIGFAIVGTAIGTLIGSKKKKFRLNGKLSPEQYEQLKEYVIPMTSNN